MNEWTFRYTFFFSFINFVFLISTTFSLSLFFLSFDGQTLIFLFSEGMRVDLNMRTETPHNPKRTAKTKRSSRVDQEKVVSVDSKVGCDGQRLRDRQTKEKSYKQQLQRTAREIIRHTSDVIHTTERERVYNIPQTWPSWWSGIASARLHQPPASSDPTTFDSINNNNNTSRYDKIRNKKWTRRVPVQLWRSHDDANQEQVFDYYGPSRV